MQFASRGADQAQLGLAPLLDVVLILSIFFVVTTSFTEPRLALLLPEAESAEIAGSHDLVVSIDVGGSIILEGRPADEEITSLAHFLRAINEDYE